MLKSSGKEEFRWNGEEATLFLTVTHQSKVYSIESPDNLTVGSTDTIKVLYSESEVSHFAEYEEKSTGVVQGNQVRKKLEGIR